MGRYYFSFVSNYHCSVMNHFSSCNSLHFLQSDDVGLLIFLPLWIILSSPEFHAAILLFSGYPVHILFHFFCYLSMMDQSASSRVSRT